MSRPTFLFKPALLRLFPVVIHDIFQDRGLARGQG
jgi:hypothetical protein